MSVASPIEKAILISTDTVPMNDRNGSDVAVSERISTATNDSNIAPVALTVVTEIIESVVASVDPIKENSIEAHREKSPKIGNKSSQQHPVEEITLKMIGTVRGEKLGGEMESTVGDEGEIFLEHSKSDVQQTMESKAINGSASASKGTPPLEINEIPVSLVSEEPMAVAVVTSEDALKSTNGINTSYHVRIDNFQRPLTDKLLFEWLAKTLGHEVRKEQLWMNKIKTHCYIDFDSHNLAKSCITAVTGKKVDLKHTLELVADFTEISSNLAENSFEGKMKPNEWKNNRERSIGSDSSSAGPGSVSMKIRSDSIPSANLRGSDGVIVSNGVAPCMSVPINSSVPLDALRKASLMATNSISKIIPQNSSVGGVSIRGNEQVGFSTRRNSNTAGIIEDNMPSAKRQNFNVDNAAEINQKYASQPQLQAPAKNYPARYESNQGSHQNNEKMSNDQNNCGDIFELDSLFRKTKALPPLYWLPVCEEIVLKRRLLNKK